MSYIPTLSLRGLVYLLIFLLICIQSISYLVNAWIAAANKSAKFGNRIQGVYSAEGFTCRTDAPLLITREVLILTKPDKYGILSTRFRVSFRQRSRRRRRSTRVTGLRGEDQVQGRGCLTVIRQQRRDDTPTRKTPPGQ